MFIHNIQCSLIRADLPGKVLTAGIDNFTTSIEAYYSAQAQEMVPSCVVLPTTSLDVSNAIKILTAGFKSSDESCHFAIRSGGHTPGAGLNNINGGVTIDLSKLDAVIPSRDRSTVRVGPGNRWGGVYQRLDALNLTVLGGRSPTVGVGGLLMGGGLSFFSPRYGMSCNNVINYEIVLAGGKIVNANQHSYIDLYKALKGGSNNFGIVTSFDLRAVEVGEMWGGTAMYNTTALPDLFERFSEFANSDGYDPYAQLTLLYGRAGRGNIVMTHQHYTKPEAPPQFVFAAFTPYQTSKTFRVANLTNLVGELIAVPDGGTIRKAFASATYKNKPEMFHQFHKIANATTDKLFDVPGLQFVISMQPFGQFLTTKGLGDTFLGLEPKDGDRVIFAMTVSWKNKSDDELVNSSLRELLEQGKTLSEELDAADDYIFMNYASPWQDVYAGVGKKNRESLKMISKKYDPLQLFRKNVAGFRF
ncbi:hypothetical protein EDB81DRAFT_641773 [Dactylonectria macrodidyma]|uniref:FAD-binding PCMH-type domain-containing protein n=1 Tax=Dactylonectria macrodidyma TaxID=307937 RepID=A0A9P9FHR2_9HYPO|nr:hypothetical protein EDB81DRAFT_641773 [Dactylonectria macrodidyma]